MLDELDVRRRAMAYVAERRDAAGGVITRAELEAFTYGGEQLPDGTGAAVTGNDARRLSLRS